MSTSRNTYRRHSSPNRGASARPGSRRSWLTDLSDSLERGLFFTVVFRKRTDGNLRKMRCRARVRRHLKGGAAPFSFDAKGLIPVWDVDAQGYRCFPVEGLRELRACGRVHHVNMPASASRPVAA